MKKLVLFFAIVLFTCGTMTVGSASPIQKTIDACTMPAYQFEFNYGTESSPDWRVVGYLDSWDGPTGITTHHFGTPYRVSYVENIPCWKVEEYIP